MPIGDSLLTQKLDQERSMRFFSPFRLATYLLVLFCFGHTAGGMLAQKSLGAGADAVFDAMKSVHFAFNGSDATWYCFWFGFGLNVSAYLVFSAIVAWQLDKIPRERWQDVSIIAWALVATQLVGVLLAFEYFFLGPALLGVAITALLTVGTLRKRA
jgi:hypothetical protein